MVLVVDHRLTRKLGGHPFWLSAITYFIYSWATCVWTRLPSSGDRRHATMKGIRVNNRKNKIDKKRTLLFFLEKWRIKPTSKKRESKYLVAEVKEDIFDDCLLIIA
jgi:hypothetical protein